MVKVQFLSINVKIMDLTNYHQFVVRLRLNAKVVILSFLFQFDYSSSITFWNVTLSLLIVLNDFQNTFSGKCVQDWFLFSIVTACSLEDRGCCCPPVCCCSLQTFETVQCPVNPASRLISRNSSEWWVEMSRVLSAPSTSGIFFLFSLFTMTS